MILGHEHDLQRGGRVTMASEVGLGGNSVACYLVGCSSMGGGPSS